MAASCTVPAALTGASTNAVLALAPRVDADALGRTRYPAVVAAASAGTAGAALSLGDGRATTLVQIGGRRVEPRRGAHGDGRANHVRRSRSAVSAKRPRPRSPRLPRRWTCLVRGRVPLTAWLAAVWALGVVIALIPTVAAFARLAIVARRARPVRGGRWALLIPSALRELDVRRRVRFLELDGPVMPMTWGVFHPVVLLPADDFDSTIEQRLDVLRHELAHVRRYDCLTQLVGQLACALHWFNPFAWVAARELRVERERACDDEVLGAGAKASDYADYLLRVARSTRIVGAAALGGLAMARPSQMAGRLLAVLDDRRRRGRVSLWARGAGGGRCRRARDGCCRRVTRLRCRNRRGPGGRRGAGEPHHDDRQRDQCRPRSSSTSRRARSTARASTASSTLARRGGLAGPATETGAHEVPAPATALVASRAPCDRQRRQRQRLTHELDQQRQRVETLGREVVGRRLLVRHGSARRREVQPRCHRHRVDLERRIVHARAARWRRHEATGRAAAQ